MYFQDITNRGTLPLLERMMSFTQARHQTLVENIANVDTPGYKAKHLDPAAFQEQLREAAETRKRTHARRLELRGTNEVGEDKAGRLTFTPSTDPAQNILFHDHTNMRIEQQMSSLAENAMMHQMTAELLQGRFSGLLKAIRGQVM